MSGSDESKKPRITPSENGPYLVRDLIRLSNSKGETLEVKANIALCRCGRSENKPFCDGTHKKVDFDSSRLTDGKWDKREDLSAGSLTIHDNRGVCAHAARCTDGLPEVFKLGEEPWIDAEGAPEARVIEQVRQCPSGALSYSRGGTEHRDQERPPAILVSKNGPYVVTGGVGLEADTWGEGVSREHFTLCRCGGSKNKPFCDGTHWKGFRDDKN